MGIVKCNVSLQNMDGFDAQIVEVIEAIDANLNIVADVVEQNAKTTSAFIDKTGNLRDSIQKKKSKFPDGGHIVKASGGNKKKGYHAHLVEFGHIQIPPGKLEGGRVPAHPFLRPALEDGIRLAVALFRKR